MGSDIKLAFLTSHPTQYASSVFRELAKQPGIDLTVIYCSAHGLESRTDPGFGVSFRWDVPLLDGYACKFVPSLPRGSSPQPPFRPFNPGVVARLLPQRYDALVVHGYAYLTYWLAFLAAKLRRTTVLIRGESTLLRKRTLAQRTIKGTLLRALFKLADGYIAIGTESARHAEFYGMDPRRVHFAPYCVDNDFFAERAAATRPRRREILTTLGLAPHQLVFSFVGKLSSRKAPMHLLEAFRRARLDGTAALVFVGDGTQRGELEASAKEHRVDNVRFAGFVNQTELPDYYGITDVLVLPSAVEPWGLVVNEAMASGCAVVTSDICGCATDLVRRGKNGDVFPVGDVGSLASVLRSLAADRERVREMGRTSREIIEDWTPGVCARGIAEAVSEARWRGRRT